MKTKKGLMITVFFICLPILLSGCGALDEQGNNSDELFNLDPTSTISVISPDAENLSSNIKFNSNYTKAIWLAHSWAWEADHTATDNLATFLENSGVDLVYLNAGSFDGDGTIPGLSGYSDIMKNNILDSLKNHQIKVYAWVNGKTKEDNPPGPIDLGNSVTRTNIVNTCKQIAQLGFNGVQLDLEPIAAKYVKESTNTKGAFIKLLDKMNDNNMGPGKKYKLSVATMKYSNTSGIWYWDLDNFATIKNRVNQMVIMAYDYGDSISSEDQYAHKITTMVNKLGAKFPGKVNIGLSANKITTSHTQFETVSAGIQGIQNASNASNLQGASLFLFYDPSQVPAEGEMPTEDEWEQFNQLFKRPFLPIDSDKDTYYVQSIGGNDCNDNNSAIFPDAPEICDDVDNQCPGDAGYGQTDEGCGAPAVTVATVAAGTNMLSALAIADVDNDNQTEIIIGGEATKILYVYTYNNYTITLKYAITLPEYMRSITVGDVDKDNKNELVIGTDLGASPSDSGGYLRVYKVSASGVLTSVWQSNLISSFRYPKEISIGDSDGDGNPEIAVSVSWDGRFLVVYEWNGSGFSEFFTDYFGSDGDASYYADVDGDGVEELLVSTACWSDYAARIYDGNILTARFNGLGVSHSIKAGNLFGDSSLEIVRFSDSVCGQDDPAPSVDIFKYNGSNYDHIGSVALPDNATTGGQHPIGDIGDIIGDGYDELAEIVYGSSNKLDSLVIYSFDGTTFYQLFYQVVDALSDQQRLSNVVIGDADGDGHDELVVLGWDNKFAVYDW